MRGKRFPNICDGRQPLGTMGEGIEFSALEGGRSYLPKFRATLRPQILETAHYEKETDVIRRRFPWGLLLLLVLAAVVAAVLAWEMRTSYFQARQLSSLAHKLTTEIGSGPSPAIRYPGFGPYDQRLGYSRLPAFLRNLKSSGYAVTAQSRFSPEMLQWVNLGLFPPYLEKDQAGLDLLDRDGGVLFSARYPEKVYTRFEEIPPLVVATLLAIENKELLDANYPKHNPAIEWDRLFKVVLQYPLSILFSERKAAGGSTLATQLEKVRHSPEGVTRSVQDKALQVVSASLRAYVTGEDTTEAQKRIVLHYLNSVPLAAAPGHGEVIGLAAGLRAWYGEDFDWVNHVLDSRNVAQVNIKVKALAYKQVLSLLLAQRRPTQLLVKDPQTLLALTDAHLRLFAKQRLISPELRDLALAVKLELGARPAPRETAPFNRIKTANNLRSRLANLLGMRSLYELDRLDMKVETTIDQVTQQAVSVILDSLSDTQRVARAGLDKPRMLAKGDPSKVIYSFSLYERGPGVNWLRVQTDNYDQPLNMAQGMRLDLGSTAKLRTLVHYLQIMAALYEQYAGHTFQELQRITVPLSDRLSRWTIDCLSFRPHLGLSEFLQAAMMRRYSASPDQRFYTGGGVHEFSNFSKRDDSRNMTVNEAFRRSVNLIFIRIMRDIVRYWEAKVLSSMPGLLEDVDHPQRQVYLRRFADREGRIFLERFYRKHAALSTEQSLKTLLDSSARTPKGVANIMRLVHPQDTVDRFIWKMRNRFPDTDLSEQAIAGLYEAYDIERIGLADRGYITHVHPLELWLVAYLRQYPGASLHKVYAASEQQRQTVYQWLFRTRNKNAQDRRIRTQLEIDAFTQIHKAWQRAGYPFEALVPSFATALGSSGDRPAALADLMGIIVNDGMRYPTRRFERFRFAQHTPYATAVSAMPSKGERVLTPEVAAVLRQALIATVEQGTAKRAHGVILDRQGRAYVVGGKTGTGDHRHHIYDKDGILLDERVVNRSATFVFFVGDRYYGVITAHVPGPDASEFRFTSSLSVELFRSLGPILESMIQRPLGNLLMAQR